MAQKASAPRPADARASAGLTPRQELATKPSAKDGKPAAIPSLPRQDPSLGQQPLVANHAGSAASAPAPQPETRPTDTASAPQDPRTACAKRRSSFVPDALNLPYMDCLERSCRRAEYQAHPECSKIREMVEKRDGRTER